VVSGEQLVAQAIANSLKIQEISGRPLQTILMDFLRDKRLLLVVDNCEHLIQHCATLVAKLLQKCPGLRILATSREPLGIGGELTWRVPSLSLPDPATVESPETLSSYEAIKLFTNRALAKQSDFKITPQNVKGLVQICSRLDGIPLAIELAAARVQGLTIEHIANRLNDRFRLLTTGSRDALPRQQTLKNTIDWSYELLTKQEQKLLRRLSVFAGGWQLEAAEAVCAGEGIEEFEVLDLLLQLVNKSLVKVEEQTGQMRYGMLETIRQYTQNKLEEAEEKEQIRGQHLDYYLRFVQQAEPELFKQDQKKWLDQLEQEHDNLRVALDWSLNSNNTKVGMADVALELGGIMAWFWEKHGHLSEGRRWLEAALAKGDDTNISGSVKAKGLAGASFIVLRQSEFALSISLATESLKLYEVEGDTSGGAWVLEIIGLAELEQGRFEQADKYFQDSLKLYQLEQNKWGLSAPRNRIRVKRVLTNIC